MRVLEWAMPRAAARKTDTATAVLYGIVCHALFVTAVGTMIAAMYFGMSRSFGAVPAPWSSLTNALLLAQLPILHSLLLTPFGRTMLRRLAPEPIGTRLSTTTYVIVASIQVLALFLLWTPSRTIWWQADGGVLWIVAALYTTAWMLLAKAILDAGFTLQTGFVGWWAVANGRNPDFPPMPRTGLFRVTRQPIYGAFALTLWTVPTWTPDQLAVALVLTSYCLAGPLLKEERFRRRFGQEFDAYRREVPYWLPWPRPPHARNDLSIYDDAGDWWEGRTPWLQTLQNLVPARLAFFDPIVGDWHGKDVLDLGCGGGFMAVALAERGARVTGVDPSKRAVASALHAANRKCVPLACCVGRGECLPVHDDAFEIVVCVDVLEHVTDIDRVLREVRRVLRPGGLFLFDTINRNPFASFVMVTLAETMLRLLPTGTHDPALFIRPAEMRQKLEAAGFRVGPFVGMGPTRLSRRYGVTFGRLPTTALQYLGAATAP
jgi:ubiquinone biosynthesis O-methyltransferase